MKGCGAGEDVPRHFGVKKNTLDEHPEYWCLEMRIYEPEAHIEQSGALQCHWSEIKSEIQMLLTPALLCHKDTDSSRRQHSKVPPMRTQCLEDLDQ